MTERLTKKRRFLFSPLFCFLVSLHKVLKVCVIIYWVLRGRQQFRLVKQGRFYFLLPTSLQFFNLFLLNFIHRKNRLNPLFKRFQCGGPEGARTLDLCVAKVKTYVLRHFTLSNKRLYNGLFAASLFNPVHSYLPLFHFNGALMAHSKNAYYIALKLFSTISYIKAPFYRLFINIYPRPTWQIFAIFGTGGRGSVRTKYKAFIRCLPLH